ncbi:ABC transporter substrate-binding protein [Lederbergia galactosidilytica]|uniref:ABC transporter substrate-binding protein n=1 Tax=Lederbergia galactosidilytica TaxID=217031 RepID=A0A178A1D9_9BACI|nr:extracellular solute-binding protein [Lederbergia galactosidilytica]KRG16131.1 ABC transporter substrate-binding protein [Virgibacillus soli]MBP1913978.1 raffinose/stachyose/melibiose transport system substrate-binding protein [Lederbergia galactosidilytica]OAK74007.1 ABC transporter substrate-binding protein [Lederbergia galactosidilytica]
MLRKKGQLFAFLMTTFLVFVGLAGCSEDKSTSSSTDNENVDGVTLSVLIGNTSSKAGVEAVAKLVEEKYNIKTEFEIRPSGAEGDNLMKTRLATGDMTDIAYYNSGSLMHALNPSKNFVDLSDEPYADKLMDSFKESVSDQNGLYGIPGNPVQVGGWFYNKKLYEELGLEVPKTWTELMENNEKIKEAGKTPVIGTYKETWTSQLIVLADNFNVLAENPDFPENYTANKAKIATTPGALKSFEKMQDIYEKGYMNEDFLSTTYDAGMKMLAEGEGAHYPMLSQILPLMAENYPDEIGDIGVFPQPGDNAEKNGFTIWMPNAYYINKNSENIDAAKKWFEVFVSEEGVAAYLAADPPIGPFAIEDVKLPEDVFTAVKDMTPYFEEDKTAPALEFLSPLKGPNLEQILIEVGSGIKSAKEGAELYDKDVEKQAKQLNLEGW